MKLPDSTTLFMLCLAVGFAILAAVVIPSCGDTTEDEIHRDILRHEGEKVNAEADRERARADSLQIHLDADQVLIASLQRSVGVLAAATAAAAFTADDSHAALVADTTLGNCMAAESDCQAARLADAAELDERAALQAATDTALVHAIDIGDACCAADASRAVAFQLRGEALERGDAIIQGQGRTIKWLKVQRVFSGIAVVLAAIAAIFL